MALAQLQLLVKFQQEKEDKLRALYQGALANYQNMQQKFDGLAAYRTDYLQQTHQRGQQGLASRQFNQYLNFISKLDKALSQQQQMVQQAKAAADQRMRQYLEMQKKRKALEHLIEKEQLVQQAKAARQEQKLLDEIATQQFFRRVS
ncbi:flagellar export protein FliJ [Rheinheimera sp.]|uniref:flagellar export protein FliJ n=1 Tax=Rheinheimera sp. TaxID=1869214 RepID=UPI00307FC882